MKKSYLIILNILILSIFLISLVSAIDPLTDLTGNINSAQAQFDKIPKTPEDIKAEYLKQEWNKIFMKIPFIGPVHTFLLNNPLIFKIIFNEPYSISLTFILILILWIITAKVIHKPAKEAFNDAVAWTLAIGVPLMFAHLSLYKIAVSKTLYLIFAQESYWMRTIAWFLIFFAVILIIMIDEVLSKKIKDAKQLKEKGRIEDEIYTVKAFMKTLKEYLGAVKKN